MLGGFGVSPMCAVEQFTATDPTYLAMDLATGHGLTITPAAIIVMGVTTNRIAVRAIIEDRAST
jgi:hypothetical protein